MYIPHGSVFVCISSDHTSHSVDSCPLRKLYVVCCSYINTCADAVSWLIIAACDAENGNRDNLL